MIKESKYIIRRILIGVGIVLILSFIRNGNVKALNTYDFNYSIDNYYKQVKNNSYQTYFLNFDYTNTLDLSTYQNYIIMMRVAFGGIDNNPVIAIAQFNGTPSFSNNGSSYDSIAQVTYSNWGYLSFPNSKINKLTYYTVNTESSNVYNNSTDSFYIYSSNYVDLQEHGMKDNWVIIDSNVDITNIGHSSSYYLDNGSISTNIPEFVSFNSTPITYNNVITSYTVQPEFTSFDTENYVYQYSFDNDIWLSLIENEQLLKINSNSTIYIRIKDLSNNDIIDSSSFTISNIGTFYNEQDYNITFSGEYRTNNFLNNSVSSKSQSIIKEYQIYIEYIPKTSILKYQYQFVPTDSQLDNNNWQNVSSLDNGSKTYVATQNGTLYARILDKENNVLKVGTFTVNSIGLLALDNSDKKLTDFYSSLRDKVNFGGPIGSLINIPVSLLQVISDSFNGITGVCSNYNLGDLFGHNLYLPCVNVKHYLGNTLYNTIDIIISCVMIYYIFKMLSNAYYQFLLLESTPISEDMSNSLNVSYRGL